MSKPLIAVICNTPIPGPIYHPTMQEYYENRCSCPKCGEGEISRTTAGMLQPFGSDYKDTNRASCSKCGWVGIVHDLVPKPKKIMMDCITSGVIGAPDWLIEQMDAILSMPPPNISDVMEQFKASAEWRKNHEKDETV